jgi:hypothetical protein
MQSYIERGLVDVQTKTLKQIQIETAYVWAGRACAASVLGLDHDALEYAHEAIEHAALSGNEAVLGEISSALAEYGVRP